MAKEWENSEENPEEEMKEETEKKMEEKTEKKAEEKMEDEMEDEMEEMEDDIIELVDENGETTLFELLGAFDMKGQHYLALSEPTEEEDPDSLEVFILKIVPDGEGGDTYVAVEDEEADEAFEAFLRIVEAQPEE